MTNPNGRFGIHGGQYIPETLMNAVKELEEAYNYYKNDPEFNRELTELLNDYAGRPSRLYYAEKMTKDLGGAKIYLKREDLNHTGAHKINNVLGQALLAKKMGKTRLIAETGAGQHGVVLLCGFTLGSQLGVVGICNGLGVGGFHIRMILLTYQLTDQWVKQQPQCRNTASRRQYPALHCSLLCLRDLTTMKAAAPSRATPPMVNIHVP